MRRKIAFAAVLALYSGIATFSYAGPNEQMHGGMMKSGSMMGHDSTCGMCAKGCGMGMIEPRQILLVDDGIIVSVSNRLIKYDKDLNIKREVRIEADSMKTMRGHMAPMYKDTTKLAPAPMKKR